MSMIILCQSDSDLKRYGFKSAYEVGLRYANQYIEKMGFTGNVWSDHTFCILYDESYNLMRPYNQNTNYKDTPVFYCLNDLLKTCNKIAVFHCEPLANTADWCIFHNGELFHKAVENALLDNDSSNAYNVTYIYERDSH